MTNQGGYTNTTEQTSPIRVCIEGKRALFTPPAFVVERKSYHVPTKSAIKGILRAVFKHDGMNYRINKIYVCNPIKTEVIWRNEVTDTQVFGSRTPKNYIDRDRCASPRGAAFLKNVKYVVEAEIIKTKPYWPNSKEHTLEQYYKMFFTHLRRGATQHTPWLGCREFECSVEEFPHDKKVETYYKNRKEDFGIMLEDIHYTNDMQGYPVMAETSMENGIIQYGQRFYPKEYPWEEENNA